MKNGLVLVALLLLTATPAFGLNHKPTFVLVHGALFTSDGWARVESELQNADEDVVSLNVPGRAGDGLAPKDVDLNVAVTKVCKVARTQYGPVILVGHSQGGALITQATAVCPENIKALVYVAAVVPRNRETAFAGLTEVTRNNFGKCAIPDPENHLFRLVDDKSVLEAAFLQDVRAQDPKLADLAVASMVDEPLLIGDSPLDFPQAVFDSLPKFYVKTTRDQVVDPANQERYISQVHMTDVYTLDASHSPFLSQPKELAKIFREISKAVITQPSSDSRMKVAH
ncbi:MAG: alpha/beta fold hydrolase [Bdellovibrionales bacterium]